MEFVIELEGPEAEIQSLHREMDDLKNEHQKETWTRQERGRPPNPWREVEAL